MKVLYKIDGKIDRGFNSLILNKTYDVLSIQNTIDNFTYYSIKNEFGFEQLICQQLKVEKWK